MKRLFPALLLFLVACSSAPSDSQVQTAIALTQASAPATVIPTDAPPTVTATPPPTATATTAPVGMSRSNPAPAGSEIVTKQYTISGVDAVRPADDAVHAENMFNTKPEDGEEYVMLRVSVTCNLSPDEQCDYYASNVFSLILPDGNVVKEKLFAGDNALGHEQHFGGSTVKKLLAFIVKKTDTDFILFITPGGDEPDRYLLFDVATP